MTPEEYLMRRQYIYFEDLPIGARFSLNGYEWRKRSSRTSIIIKPEEYSRFWAYFGKRKLCIVGRHSRI